MADYAKLKDAITKVIKTNGNQEITGQILQNTLLSIVNVIGEERTFAGVATPDTNPGNPDQNVIWTATQKGTYTGFGNYVHDGVGIAFFGNTSSGWQAVKMNVVGVDSDGNPIDPNIYLTKERFEIFKEDLYASLTNDTGSNDIHAQYDNHGNVIFDYYASKESVADLSKSIGSEKGSESEDGSVWGKLISLGNDGLVLSQEISDLSVKMDDAFTQNGFIWTFAGTKVDIVFKDNGNTSIAFPEQTVISYGNTSVICDMGISMIVVPAATKNLYLVFNISKGKVEVVTAQNQMNGTVLLGWISSEVKTAFLKCSDYTVNGKSMNPANYLLASDIVDGLISTSVDKPLSANMGRILSTQNGMMQVLGRDRTVSIDFSDSDQSVTISLPSTLLLSYGNARIIDSATSNGQVITDPMTDNRYKYLIYNLSTSQYELVLQAAQMNNSVLVGWINQYTKTAVLRCDNYTVDGVSQSFKNYISKSNIAHDLVTTDVNKVLGADQAVSLATQNGFMQCTNPGSKVEVNFNANATEVTISLPSGLYVSYGNSRIISAATDNGTVITNTSNDSLAKYLVYNLATNSFEIVKYESQMKNRILLGWIYFGSSIRSCVLLCDRYSIDGNMVDNQSLSDISYANITTTVIQLKKVSDGEYTKLNMTSFIDTEVKITGGRVSFDPTDFRVSSVNIKKGIATDLYFICVEPFAVIEAKGVYRLVNSSYFANSHISQNVSDFGDHLTEINLPYRSNVYGDLCNLSRNMVTLNLTESAPISPELKGNLSDLPRLLTYCRITSSKSNVSGNVADLPRKLTFLYLNTGSGSNITGNISDLPRSLEVVQMYNLTSAFTGNIIDAPRMLTTLLLSSPSFIISGNVTDLPPLLNVVNISGKSTISGDILDLPKQLTSAVLAGECSLKGRLADLPIGIIAFNIKSTDANNQITGDISNIPNKTMVFLELYGHFNVTFNGDFPLSDKFYNFKLAPEITSPIDSTTVDSILIKLAAIAGKRTGTRTIALTGACDAPTEASQAAIASLQQKGFTVQTN